MPTGHFSHMPGNTNKCMDKTVHASLYIFFNYLYSLKQNLFAINPCNANKGNTIIYFFPFSRLFNKNPSNINETGVVTACILFTSCCTK